MLKRREYYQTCDTQLQYLIGNIAYSDVMKNIEIWRINYFMDGHRHDYKYNNISYHAAHPTWYIVIIFKYSSSLHNILMRIYFFNMKFL